MSQLEFRPGMDPHSRDVILNQENLGMLQWHDGNPRLILITNGKTFIELSLTLLKLILAENEKNQAANQT